MGNLVKENELDNISIDTVYKIGERFNDAIGIKLFTYDLRGIYMVLRDKTIKDIK